MMIPSSLLWPTLFLSLMWLSETTSTPPPATGYLYRTMHLPQKSYPVQDYHDPDGNSGRVPLFLVNNGVDYPRIVEFYSPLCPHCQQFAPKYAQFARKFLNLTSQTNPHYNELSSIHFHAISCIAYRKLCQHENVRNYPPSKCCKQMAMQELIIKDFELHPFKLAKIFGLVAVDDGYTKIEQQEKQTKRHTKYKRRRYKRDATGKIVKRIAKDKLEKTTDSALDIQRHTVVNEQEGPTNNGIEIFPNRARMEVFSDAYLSFIRRRTEHNALLGH